jgi:hypothetical protein
MDVLFPSNEISTIVNPLEVASQVGPFDKKGKYIKEK